MFPENIQNWRIGLISKSGLVVAKFWGNWDSLTTFKKKLFWVTFQYFLFKVLFWFLNFHFPCSIESSLLWETCLIIFFLSDLFFWNSIFLLMFSINLLPKKENYLKFDVFFVYWYSNSMYLGVKQIKRSLKKTDQRNWWINSLRSEFLTLTFQVSWVNLTFFFLIYLKCLTNWLNIYIFA